MRYTVLSKLMHFVWGDTTPWNEICLGLKWLPKNTVKSESKSKKNWNLKLFEKMQKSTTAWKEFLLGLRLRKEKRSRWPPLVCKTNCIVLISRIHKTTNFGHLCDRRAWNRVMGSQTSGLQETVKSVTQEIMISGFLEVWGCWNKEFRKSCNH